MKNQVDGVLQNDKELLKLLHQERENSELMKMELESK